MRTSAQWQKRMGKLAVDSIRPPGTKSRHTDLAHTIQRKMHAIQRSFLQNFFQRLWFQSPHLCRAHVLKAENFHRRVQPDFFLTFFFGCLNASEHSSPRTCWRSCGNRLTLFTAWTFWTITHSKVYFDGFIWTHWGCTCSSILLQT